MKKHLSVIALLIAIRFKVIMSFLAILIGFNLLSLVSYSLIFKESLTKFDMVVFEEWLGIFFVIIFLFFFAATAYECKSEKGYSKYTRIRLRIPERMLAGWEGAVCAAGFLMFWQAEVIFIFCMGEVRNMAKFGNGAMMMLKLMERKGIFYRVVFPIDNGIWWLTDALVMIACGGICVALSLVGKGNKKKTAKTNEETSEETNVRD